MILGCNPWVQIAQCKVRALGAWGAALWYAQRSVPPGLFMCADPHISPLRLSVPLVTPPTRFQVDQQWLPLPSLPPCGSPQPLAPPSALRPAAAWPSCGPLAMSRPMGGTRVPSFTAARPTHPRR